MRSNASMPLACLARAGAGARGHGCEARGCMCVRPPPQPLALALASDVCPPHPNSPGLPLSARHLTAPPQDGSQHWPPEPLASCGAGMCARQSVAVARRQSAVTAWWRASQSCARLHRGPVRVARSDDVPWAVPWAGTRRAELVAVGIHVCAVHSQPRRASVGACGAWCPGAQAAQGRAEKLAARRRPEETTRGVRSHMRECVG